MQKNILALLLFFCPLAIAKIEALSPGPLYMDDAAEYGKLNGTDWYSVTFTPTKVKKIKLTAPEDPDYVVAPALLISGDEKAMFFVRGIDLKEGEVKDSQKDIPISETETALQDGICSVYYTSEKFKPAETPDNEKLSENREFFVKCKGQAYSIQKFTLGPNDYTPSISWAGDLNGDGLPEFKIHFDPWEKSAPESVYFSEKTDDGYKYTQVRLQYQSC